CVSALLTGTQPVQMPTLLQLASGAAAPVQVWAAARPAVAARRTSASNARSDVAGIGVVRARRRSWAAGGAPAIRRSRPKFQPNRPRAGKQYFGLRSIPPD